MGAIIYPTCNDVTTSHQFWSFLHGNLFPLIFKEIQVGETWRYSFYIDLPKITLPKTNMDTQNDGLKKATPFKNGNCWYLC